ncbi:MAG: ribosome maturation factor RimM [Lentihominibacter sp.]|jgi:16S rRNA processing protein RimM
MDENAKIKIGEIVNVHGLNGEIKVYNYSDSIDIYRRTRVMYFGDRLIEIRGVREQKGMVLLKLEGIDDRDGAERMRGTEVFVTEEDLPELPEGQYYVRDLIGMEVLLAEDCDGYKSGENLGIVTDVIQRTAQDLFEVEAGDGRKVLIPRVPEFVININEDKRVITVRLIEGMLQT